LREHAKDKREGMKGNEGMVEGEGEGGGEGGGEDALERRPVKEEEKGADHGEHVAGIGCAVFLVESIEDHGGQSHHVG
jgi:hypothetical protein